MGQRRVDGIFGNVAFYTEVIVAVSFVFRESAALIFHLAGCLPGAGDDLADTAHCLRVGAHHAEYAHIVENVFSCNGLRADSGIREGNVLGNTFVQMMAYHQHIQMLIDGVDGERHCRICGRRENVGERGCPDDVRSVSAAGALCVVGMDRAAGNGVQCVLHASAFVQGICMDCHLYVIVVGYIQTVVDDCRGAAPVLVDFQPHGTGFYLFNQGFFVGAVAFSEKSQVYRVFFGGFQHHFHVPGTGSTGGGIGAVGWTGSSADHCSDTAVQCGFNLLRGNKVNMCIQAAGGDDQSFRGKRFGGSPHSHARGYAVHDGGISGFSDAGDFSVLDADICFIDSGIVDDQGVGDDKIQIPVGAAGFY